MKVKALFFSTLFFFSLAATSIAQKTQIYVDKEADYKLALELFNKEKYSAAQRSFLDIIEKMPAQSEVSINSEYYSALCALELFNTDAEQQLLTFIYNHPESQKVKLAYFQMGNFKYRKKRFEDASEWYEKVDIYNLTNDQLSEYYFKAGYCYFDKKIYDKSKKLFFEIKDIDNKYAVPATYYYSHIAYVETNYETAMQGFIKLKQNSIFSSVVPYYITQIYYLQGKYDEVIAYGPSLLDSLNTKRIPEIAHIVGDAYCRTARYKEAIPYLEKFLKQSTEINRNDHYQIGYAYYKTNDFKKASLSFQKVVVDTVDILTQTGYYHLADCYLQLGNKQGAKNAFFSASKLNFDPTIKEDALYSYAKLAYELDDNPFQNAIEGFDLFIKEYPTSPRLDEVYHFLVNVYLSTKNYDEALNSIEKIKSKSLEIEFAYQKIAFYRGVELFNDKKYLESIALFDKSLSTPKDKRINAEAHYWKADANYRIAKYDEALVSYKAFLFEPGAAVLNTFNTVNYNIAYSYFQKSNYTEAATWFRKYTGYKNEKDSKKINDAFIRTGDCYFINKDYSNAIDYYDEAIKIHLIDNDYALFQKANSLGVLGKYDGKVSNLETILSNYPTSPYLDDAIFELGNTFQVQNNSDKALVYFKRVVVEYPNSSYSKKALLKTALIYFNTDQNEAALEVYKKVIAAYPSTPEAKEAINGMKNVYVEQGNIAEFEAYLKGQTGVSISPSTLDSTTYEAAENRYMKGDCENSSKDFKNYIDKYPNGYFLLNANFYYAECMYKMENLTEALIGYKYASLQSKNKFTEKSLLRAGYISFKQNNFTDAINHYEKLEQVAELPSNIMEARIGQMRSHFKLNQYLASITQANKLLQTEKVSNELVYESHLTIAKSALSLKNDSLAMTEFVTTANLTKNIMGAEAKYNVALLQFKQNKIKEAEKTIFELVDQIPSYDYWIAKSFILLAEVYYAKADNFQAKSTLQSIIDNYEGKDLVNEAQDRLNQIIEIEKAEEQKRKQQEMEIKFDTNNINDNELFEEDIIPNQGGNNE